LLPADVRKIIEDNGFEAGLAFEVLKTKSFTPTYFLDEIRGLADAVNMSFDKVLRFQLFPELIKAQCTIVGSWGDATQQSMQGELLQLRALDFSTDGPMRLYPLLTVYHPQSSGHAFATLGWNGFVGALTGFSPYVGASEKVWVKYNGTDSRAGIPWHFLFRDILQFDESVNDAIKRIENAHRTCSLFLGLGDHHNNFKVVEYSYERVEIFGDDTPFPGYEPTPEEHPLIKNVVYVDKSTQPNHNPCLGSLLQKYYGNIDMKAYINVVSLLQSGELHVGIYDYQKNNILVSVATQLVPYPPPNPALIVPAYDRQFIQLDANALFNI